MSDFEWFYFQSLSIEQFTEAVEVESQQAAKCFGWWDRDYQRCLKNFLGFQRDSYLRFEFSKFTRHHNLHVLYPSDLWEYPEYWDLWKEFTEEQDELDPTEEVVRTSSSSGLTSIADILAEGKNQHSSGWTYRSERQAKSAWFALNNPAPSSVETQRLRELPYPEYLKTTHWRRIRASMLLIEFAHCADCDKECPESYYGGGWESELHVHHHTYKNRGKERYEDLELLCNRHHQLHHQASPLQKR